MIARCHLEPSTRRSDIAMEGMRWEGVSTDSLLVSVEFAPDKRLPHQPITSENGVRDLNCDDVFPVPVNRIVQIVTDIGNFARPSGVRQRAATSDRVNKAI